MQRIPQNIHTTEIFPDQYPYLLADMQKTVLSLSKEAAIPQFSDKLPQSICEACAVLSSDFSKNIELPSLARRLGLSYETFQKQFKKYTDTTPGAYRNQQRLEQAALLLKSGISVKEAAAMTGYGDAYAFTREFKKAVGCPPGKYRKLSTAKF